MDNNIIPFLSRGDEAEFNGWLEALRNAMPQHTIENLELLNDTERVTAKVAIVADPEPSDLDLLPNLRWVQSLWAGVEKIVAELPEGDLKIVRLEDPQMARTMAEAVLAWTLYLHREMPRYRSQQSEKIWQQHELRLPEERTVGILGLGQLGRAAAGKLLQQDFRVCGWSRSQTSLEGVATYSGRDGLSAVLSQSDIIVVLIPLTAQTRGLIGSVTLSEMSRGTSLINFARGPVIDDAALLSALDSGHLKHAVLDVFSEEPLPTSSPFWSHESVSVLPHISAPTTRSTASKIAADNIARYFSQGVIPKAVDRSHGY